MIDIKVSLSVAIPGTAIDPISTKVVEKTKMITLKNGKKIKKTFKDTVEDWSNADVHSFTLTDPKTKEKQVIHYATAKRLPAKQHLNISREAYDYMISRDACPEWEKAFMWKQMSKNQRLSSHMQRIAETLGGKVIEFVILED